MQKKFEANRTKIKGGCQSVKEIVTHDSKSDLPLAKKKSKFNLFQINMIHNIIFFPLFF